MSTDSTAVVVGDTLVITDARGSRIVIARTDGQPYGIAVTGRGAHIPDADLPRLIQFLGGHIVTEEEVLARIAQTAYYDAVVELGRQHADVLERAVLERIDEPAPADSVLYDARVLLGLDGGTGARDINDDGPACRVCGCTQNRACPGGCSWVPDPAGQGHLCSACLEAGRG